MARRRRGLGGGAGVDRVAFIQHMFTQCCRCEVSRLAQANRAPDPLSFTQQTFAECPLRVGDRSRVLET